MRLLAAVMLCGCGRVGFDAQGVANRDGQVVGVDVLSSDLVVHFPFDASLFTDTAGSHNAVCFGGPCPTLVAGHTGLAAHFSGGECLQIPFSGDFQLPEFTAAAWVSPGGVATDGEVFSRPRDGATSSNNSFEVFLRGTASEWFVCNSVDCSPFVATTTGWHHIAVTYGAGILHGYFDGIQVTNRASTSLPYGTDPLVIGCDIDNGVPVAKLDGDVDDIRLYNRALTPAEIGALAQ